MRKLTRFTLIGLPIIAASFGVYVGCGSNDAASILSSVFPAGIVSPTTTSDSRRRSSITRGFDLFGGTTGCGDGKSIEDQISDIQKASDPANLASTATALASFSAPGSFRPSCFGPTWHDNATGVDVNRPSGDLGIVYASASDTDTTACVACQLNALISSGPGIGNKLIKVVALGEAALANAGKSLPAVGGEEDVLAALPAVTGITFSAFKLARLDDRDGHAVYKTSIEFTDSASKSGTVTLYHEQIAADNSEYKGILYATLPHTPSGGGAGTFYRGISFVYDLEGGVYKFSFKTAANRATSSTDFFDSTSKVLDFSKRAAFGEDAHYILGYFDTANFGGTLHYAWQAGDADGATRAFAVDVPNAAKGSRTGTGYFGFGAQISAITSSTVPWMTKMHCNWLNALGSGPSLAKVEKQVMTDAGGDFVASTSNINFAPTDTCDKGSSGGWTVSSGESSFLNGARSTSGNDLLAAPVAADFSYNFATSGNEPTFTIP